MSVASPLAPPAAEPAAEPSVSAPMTEAEYLRIERAATEGLRAEFDGSRRIPMSGASRRHIILAKLIERLLDELIAARPAAERAARKLMTFRSDLRLRVPGGRYRYPDVLLTPDPPEVLDEEQDTVLNPLLIVEALSPSTERTDRGIKLAEYRTIPTLTDYLLVDQSEPLIDHYRRTGGGESNPGEPDRWEVTTHRGPTATVPLAGLGELNWGEAFGAV